MTTILKLGSSALRSDADLATAVDDIYRRHRRGEKLCIIISAIGDTTDQLLARASACAATPQRAPDSRSGSLATLLATGEHAATGLLGLALERAGIPCETLDARALGITTRGPLCDAEPTSLDRRALDAAFTRAPIVIAPGFVGIDSATGRLTLLGRGGSDLTAIFLAAQLNARCVLIKDVAGLYTADPAAHLEARRYDRVTWQTAARANTGLIQPKALDHARKAQLEVEVTTFAPASTTRIGAGSDRLSDPAPPRRPLRICLLGRGTVGAGVYTRLLARPDLFEITAVAVRRPERHTDVPADLLTSDPWEALARPSDIVIELIGGTEPAGELIEAALRRGRHIITANKALIADRGIDLERLARAHSTTLLYSAAVGGSTPAIELVASARAQGAISRIEGVLNGTTSYILDAIARGSDLAAALAEAQKAGYAEADPSLDISGEDLRHKVAILARRAWPGLPVVFARRAGLAGADPDWVRQQRAQGRIVRLVGAARPETGRIVASSTLEALAPDHPLGAVTGAGNAIALTLADGSTRCATGEGAGRWPTATAVIADLLDLTPRLARRSAAGSGWADAPRRVGSQLASSSQLTPTPATATEEVTL